MKNFIWIVSGHELPDIAVVADSYDEALKIARNKNANYSGGHILNAPGTAAFYRDFAVVAEGGFLN
ncbi:MAG: hypothetical protein IJZ63_04235 [Clostridia bacterium]|nr:hypothetical protein [Clostridia bacterium]